MFLLYKSFTALTTTFMVAVSCTWHADQPDSGYHGNGLQDVAEEVAPRFPAVESRLTDFTEQTAFQTTAEKAYYIGDDNEVIAVERDTGKVLWIRQVPKAPSGDLLVTDDLILFSSFDGSLNAVEIHSGETRWCCYTDDAFLSQPVAADAEGLFSSLSERVYRIDLVSGKLVSVADEDQSLE